MTSSLILGTAQFGSDYGIVNARGKVPAPEVFAILDLAREAGIGRIDTAGAYGDSEELLGHYGVADLRIITKVPKLHHAVDRRIAILEFARQSCQRLGCERLHGLLLHSAADLIGRDGNTIHAGLLAARDAGLAEKIGVSVYEADEIEAILGSYAIDIVQLPVSVLDQRLCTWLPRLADRGVAAHARSIFLQGLLLCPAEKLPDRLAGLGWAIEAFRERASRFGLQTIEAAIAFVRGLPHLDGIVVGSASIEEFRALLKAAAVRASFDAGGLAVTDTDLIDPRRWTPA
jgi:aryl-alcohol dehydrogenase-like predicted oxidoreductase